MLKQFISDLDVKKLIDMKTTMRVVEDAFKAYYALKSNMPSKVYVDLQNFNGDFRAMPCYEASQNIVGIKWVNVYPDNRRQNLPTVMAYILLNDPKTGRLLGIFEATELTSMRTGAAGGIAIKYCTKENVSSVGFVGAGNQAIYQLKAICEVRDIKVIHVVDPNSNSISLFISKVSKFYKGNIQITQSVAECVRDMDIIVTTTPSKIPLLKSDMCADHAHINSIGADAAGKQECYVELLKKAQIIVDDEKQALASGELNVPFSLKQIQKSDIKTSLGALVSLDVVVNKDELTLFDSTGLAIQDIALAGYILHSLNKNS